MRPSWVQHDGGGGGGDVSRHSSPTPSASDDRCPATSTDGIADFRLPLVATSVPPPSGLPNKRINKKKCFKKCTTKNKTKNVNM